MIIQNISKTVKNRTARRLRNIPKNIKSRRNNAPINRIIIPPKKPAIISGISDDPRSSTGILKIGRKSVLKKSHTENKLRKNRTNSFAVLTILTIACV